MCSFSKSDNPRHIVIDHSVLVEEIATETIARLLKIDLKTSKALGYKSGALGFSQKILLIQDKVGIDNVKNKKIVAFSNIRNKFAHVKEVKTWSDFFSLSDDNKAIEKNLYKWYESFENNETDYNDEIRLLYYYLTSDVFYFLLQINLDWAKQTGEKMGEEKLRIILFDFMKEKSQTSEEASTLWNEFTQIINDTLSASK